MNQSPWIFAGLAPSFINIEPSADLARTARRKTKIDDPQSGQQHETDLNQKAGCKIFQSCSSTQSTNGPVELTPEDALSSLGLEEQVLVFQYRGKFHAVNHECPHRSYPLSKGALYDIEDFGIILSAGITCPKHGWAFDLHTGESDKGGYKMKVWDVEIRDRQQTPEGDESGQMDTVQEVWIRKKRQRIG